MRRNLKNRIGKKDNKPKIVITKPLKGGNLFYLLSSFAIRLSGATPIKLDSSDNYKNKDFDGLIISGGSDINPSLYNSKIKMQRVYDTARDDMEQYLIKKSLAENKPILGICRGAQIINVTMGGDLHADLKLVNDQASSNSSLWEKIFDRRKVNIFANSKLWKIYESRKARVNSIHNQTISNLGDGLKISAIEQNGIIQAVESILESNFILGVQWHPELMIYNKENRKIFKTLVKNCKIK